MCSSVERRVLTARLDCQSGRVVSALMDDVVRPHPDEAEHLVEPTFAPWDGRRVPVTLLGGYLGSGKTTVLNELLARTDRPIAVLVNDVGEVNIDAALIARQTSDTIELTDGCVCCSMVNGFVEAFNQLRQRDTPPDHVIVELSGVAEPARAAPWAGTLGFRLDGIVVLVDAEQFPLREKDEWIGDVVRNQVRSADLLVITKCDLVDEAELRAVHSRISELAPGVPITVPAGSSPTAALLDLGTRRPGGVEALPVPALFDTHITTLVPVADPIDEAALTMLLDGLGSDVLRAKGVCNVTDGRRVLVQIVGHRRDVSDLPMAENQPATPLVVITSSGAILTD